jgi:glucans biosynthesis protein C
MSQPAPRPAAARRFDIDNLRNLAVLALILFHTARLFNHESWHVKDAAKADWADYAVAIIHQTQMPLLFLLAGASAYYALTNKGFESFSRERVLRLLVPLITGIFLIVPPQIYIEHIAGFVSDRYHTKWHFDGGYLDFYGVLLRNGPLDGNHLWFIAYLFIYSVGLGPFLFAWGRGEGAERWGRRLARGGLFLILPTVYITVVQAVVLTAFPENHGLTRDWGAHLHFVFAVLAGWLLTASPTLMAATKDWRRLSLAVSILLFAVVYVPMLIEPQLRQDQTIYGIIKLLYAIGEWPMMMAMLGYAQAHLNRRIPLLTAFTRYAFPFYLFHQTVIVVLGYWFYGWVIDPFTKFAVICVLATGISLALCFVCDATPVTRAILGMKTKRNGVLRSAMAAD